MWNWMFFSRTATNSFTGMLTSPNVIEPVQSDRDAMAHFPLTNLYFVCTLVRPESFERRLLQDSFGPLAAILDLRDQLRLDEQCSGFGHPIGERAARLR